MEMTHQRTQFFYGFKPLFRLANSACVKDFALKNVFFFANSFWVFLWSCIFQVFGFIFRYFSSFLVVKSGEVGSNFDGLCGKFDEGIDENDVKEVKYDQIGEKEIVPKLNSEMGSISNASTSKYQFLTGNSYCAFIEEPQIMSFTVQELFVNSQNNSPNRQVFPDELESPSDNLLGFSIDSNDISFSDNCCELNGKVEIDDYSEPNGEEKFVKQGKTETSFCGFISEEKEALSLEEYDFLGKLEFSDQSHSSISNPDDFWATIHKTSYDEITIEPFEPKTPIGIGDHHKEDYDEDSPRSLDEFPLDHNSLQIYDANINNENEDIDSQYIEIEPRSLNSTAHVEDYSSEDELSDSESDLDQENSNFDGLKVIDGSENCDEEDVLLEQKELIRQMKKEMRQLKISGLPTILEESESPRVEDDLRPLKIDERIGHKDLMEEILTFYKRYLDQMRKLDVLSQQTMYAIGLLQLKNQHQMATNKIVSVPVIKSLLAQNFWSNKLRKHEAEPVQKLIRDLQRDLELAYIGQLCFSWEILKWQHHKAEELHAYDPDGFRQHNQVAGEFQKFQVLLQRFTEDEPFHQGPRVQHYLKSRCALPNLLQVPLIKDDTRGEWRGNGEDGVSMGMLKEVIGASIRAFWEFLRADNDEVHATALMGITGVQVDLQDPSDAEMLIEIRSILQKKERRLKDLVRSGNCLVRKFQKNQDQRLSHEMFLAQVELRLVSRILNMSRLTTDQLLWCHKKINKINIIGRKIYFESSFLLFPC